VARQLLLLVCGHFRRELACALSTDGFAQVRAGCHPALCLHPSDLRYQLDQLREDLEWQRQDGEDVVLLGLCFLACGSGLEETLGAARVHRQDSCFDLFLGREQVRRLHRQGAHLLTPGWLEHWREHLERWGFDQPTAREFFGESAQRLVLLDTGVLEESKQQLAEMAEWLDLPSAVIEVGLEHFTAQVLNAVLQWHLEAAHRESELFREQTNIRLARQAMAFELLVQLTRELSVPEAIAEIKGIFAMLTGARSVEFHPASHPILPADEDFSCSENGFAVVARFGEEAFGTLVVEQLPVPDRVDEYLNLSLAILPICALSLARARAETQRRRAQGALELKAEELEQSNADLARFASVVSHDLQAPLTSISGFLELLQLQAGEALDPESADYVRRALTGAGRMGRMIRDLLAYSQVGTSEITLGPVPLGRVIELVRANLAAAIQQSEARIIIPAELPLVLGQESMLVQLLQNLVENALKFRGDEPPLLVLEVQSFLDDDPAWHRISLRDNGIGLAREDVERAFGIFQRLDPDRDVAGTGIGLAVCRRIVERHGGSIGVRSRPGQGATFHFTLLDAGPG